MCCGSYKVSNTNNSLKTDIPFTDLGTWVISQGIYVLGIHCLALVMHLEVEEGHVLVKYIQNG
jgi:hypothetical protein